MEYLLSTLDCRGGIGDADLEGLLGLLPEFRRDYAMRYRDGMDRYRCAMGYLLLADLLEENFGIEDMGDWDYGENGKPRLRDYPELEFNISHCKSVVCCVLSDAPIGVDVEDVMDYEEELARRICSDEEFVSVGGDGLALTALWTRKEAYMKYRGEGLVDDLEGVLKGDLGCDIETEEGEGWVLSICG